MARRGSAYRETGKNSLCASGLNFGWSCITWRQPAIASTANNPTGASLRSFSMGLAGDLGNGLRFHTLEEPAGRNRIVLSVGRENNQEEPVFGRERKSRHIEHRVVWHWQSIQREHSKDGGQAGE